MSDPSKSLAVLAIGAHPDDVEFLCAGTLALLKEKGYKIFIASLSGGDCGSNTLSREDIANARVQEARRSASVIGGEYFCLNASDFHIFFGEELCRRTTGLIRFVSPDIVFTHAAADYLSDHEETSRIVRQSCFAAPVRNYRTNTFSQDEASTSHIPHLYYCDAVEGTDLFGEKFFPSLVIDISSVIDTKEKMLAQHESQREWLRVQHGCDHYLRQMREWSEQRGRQAFVPFGEGFRQHRGHAFPKENILKSVLGDLVHVFS